MPTRAQRAVQAIALAVLVLVHSIAVSAPSRSLQSAAQTVAARTARADAVALRALRATTSGAPVRLLAERSLLRRGSVAHEAVGSGAVLGLEREQGVGLTVRRRTTGLRARSTARLYWLDLLPGAKFPHSGVMALVEDGSGRLIGTQKTLWPVFVNGEPGQFERQVYSRSKPATSSRRSLTSGFAGQPRTLIGLTGFGVHAQTPPAPAPVAPPAALDPDLAHECIVALVAQDPMIRGDRDAVRDLAATLGVRHADTKTPRAMKAAVDEFVAAGCKDVVLWLSGHGFPAIGSNIPALSRKVVPASEGDQPNSTSSTTLSPNRPTTPNPTTTTPSPTVSKIVPESEEAQIWLDTETDIFVDPVTGEIIVGETKEIYVTATDLRSIMRSHPKVDFKVVVDACFAGRWSEIELESNVVLVAASSMNDQTSFSAGDGEEYRGTQIGGQIRLFFDQPIVKSKIANPWKAGTFTAALVTLLKEWKATRAARTETGNDLGRAINWAFRLDRMLMADLSMLRGMTDQYFSAHLADRAQPTTTARTTTPTSSSSTSTSTSTTLTTTTAPATSVPPGTVIVVTPATQPTTPSQTTTSTASTTPASTSTTSTTTSTTTTTAPITSTSTTTTTTVQVAIVIEKDPPEVCVIRAGRSRSRNKYKARKNGVAQFTGFLRVRTTGPGVESGGDQTVSLAPTGTATVDVEISSIGNYVALADFEGTSASFPFTVGPHTNPC